MKKIAGTLVGALLCLAMGCATMFNTENQNLTFNSTPDSADIEVNGTVLGKTPWTGPVKRGSEQAVTIKKDGFEPQIVQLKGEVSGWVVANVLWGVAGVISTTVDVSNGSGYAYAPDAYHVTLVSKGTATAAALDIMYDGKLKRFVLISYADIARDAFSGGGEKLEALREMTGHRDRMAFAELCRRELAAAPGADAFAERMIKLHTAERVVRR